MPVSSQFRDLPDLAQIRILRKKLGWTQRELARATGLSQSFINKIERNEADPGYRTAKRIFQTIYKTQIKDKDEDRITALDIMTMNVEYVASWQTFDQARQLMIKKEYSQLPVIDNGIVKGSISERLLVKGVDLDRKSRVGDVMEKRFPVVDPDTKLQTLRFLLSESPAVLVDKGDRNYGIVTKHDLLKAMK